MILPTESASGPSFALGLVVSTPGVLDLVSHAEIFASLRRHQCGDWGDVCREDWQANDEALKTGGRLLSSYKSQLGEKFWIITEADRSSTIALLPSEY